MHFLTGFLIVYLKKNLAFVWPWSTKASVGTVHLSHVSKHESLLRRIDYWTVHVPMATIPMWMLLFKRLVNTDKKKLFKSRIQFFSASDPNPIAAIRSLLAQNEKQWKSHFYDTTHTLSHTNAAVVQPSSATSLYSIPQHPFSCHNSALLEKKNIPTQLRATIELKYITIYCCTYVCRVASHLPQPSWILSHW